jgi:hypothetical protein
MAAKPIKHIQANFVRALAHLEKDTTAPAHLAEAVTEAYDRR